MASGNDLIKYVTEKVIQYMDEPSEVRKERKEEKKQWKEPAGTYLFGMIPSALGLMFKKKKR